MTNENRIFCFPTDLHISLSLSAYWLIFHPMIITLCRLSVPCHINIFTQEQNFVCHLYLLLYSRYLILFDLSSYKIAFWLFFITYKSFAHNILPTWTLALFNNIKKLKFKDLFYFYMTSWIILLVQVLFTVCWNLLDIKDIYLVHKTLI